jgi:hypothetical protein
MAQGFLSSSNYAKLGEGRMYESRNHRPLSRPHFVRRLLRHFLAAVVILIGSLALGMAGYVYFETLSWRSAFLNAAMLLGGMGPVDSPQTDGGKVFAGFYALYAGLVFIVVTGIVLAPVVHRVLHKFHADAQDPE